MGWPTIAPSVRWQTLSLETPHQVTLWLFELDAVSTDAPGLTACLSAPERARAQRCTQPLHARRLRVAWSMVRHLLGQLSQRSAAEITWSLGPHGKPALATPPATPHFNLSHSAGWALLATSETVELGVDLETTDAALQLAEMAPRILSETEHAAMKATGAIGPDQLLNTWVRKEACLKALGTGLIREMDTITLLEGEVRATQPQADDPGAASQLRWLDVALPPGCEARAALAWLRPVADQ